MTDRDDNEQTRKQMGLLLQIMFLLRTFHITKEKDIARETTYTGAIINNLLSHL